MQQFKLYQIKQKFSAQKLSDISGALSKQLPTLTLNLKNKNRIAIAVGSRGISNQVEVVRALVVFLNEMGIKPFVVPAMGSHGGATAAGQEALLASYGITKKNIGAPIQSSMAVYEIPQMNHPNRIYIDRYAWESDGVILVNRIKPHTDFHGSYESGLVKMGVIGLGKHHQALEIHRFGVAGLRDNIPQTFMRIISTGKIIGGIGIIENAYDEILSIHTLKAEDILQQEPELLQIARTNMPKLPLKNIDILLIDRMGKDISGAGMDPNIIGRIRIRGEQDLNYPKVTTIIVDDLTDESHGNALGVGLADITTKKLFKKIDFKVTNANTLTSTFLERGKIPVVAEDAKHAMAFAVRNCWNLPVEKLRIIRIKDTLHLEKLQVSPTVIDELKNNSHIEISDDPVHLFNSTGNMVPFL